MELDRYQQADLSQQLVHAYEKLSHDEEVLELLNFYKCYRAYVRGKVESFKLGNPYIPEGEKAMILPVVWSYLNLTESYTFGSN